MGLLPDAIKQVSENIVVLNKYLDTEDIYIRDNIDSLDNYNLRLINFKNFDMNKIGEEDLYIDSVLFESEDYKGKRKNFSSEKINMRAKKTTGVIYTFNQNEKIKYYQYNTGPVVNFKVRGNTAIISFHTVRIRSTYGNWKVSTVTASA